MKRILAFLLASIMLLSLCACGNNNDSTGDGDQSDNKTGLAGENESNSFFEENGALVWKTPYNGVYGLSETPTHKTEWFEAVITKVETDETDGIHDENGGRISCIDNVQITYTVKNVATVPIRLSTLNCKINGYTMPFSSMLQKDIQPGETIEQVVKFSSDLLAGSDNEYILDGVVTISVEEVLTERKPDGYVKYKETCDLTFKTDSKGENKYYTGGEVVYDKDGLKITVQYTGWISTNNEKFFDVMPVRLYIENNTNEEKLVGYDSVIMEGDTKITLVENDDVVLNPGEASRFADKMSVSPNSKAYHLLIIDTYGARVAVEKITNLKNVMVKPAIFEIDENNKDEYGYYIYNKTVLDEVTLSTKR